MNAIATDEPLASVPDSDDENSCKEHSKDVEDNSDESQDRQSAGAGTLKQRSPFTKIFSVKVPSQDESRVTNVTYSPASFEVIQSYRRLFTDLLSSRQLCKTSRTALRQTVATRNYLLHLGVCQTV